MTAKNASEKGFHYTGMAWYKWNTKDEEYYKEKARTIKKTFKGADYRIVTESNGWKHIYGNKLFNEVAYYNVDWEKDYLDSFSERVKRLTEEYEDKLKRLTEDQTIRQEKYNRIMAIKVG